MALDEDGRVATKPPAPATSAPVVADALSAPSAYLDWASTVQALHGGGPVTSGMPPAFCPPPSSFCSPSPYIRGNQSVTHGAPILHTSLYPHGSVYAHPAMSLAATVLTGETEAKRLKGSDRDLKKTYDDSSGNVSPLIGNCRDGDKATSVSVNADPLGNVDLLTGSSGDGDKTTSSSVNVDPSHSDESGGEEFSKNSRDDEINPCDLSISEKRSYDQMFPASVKEVSSLSATSLINGMDPWNSSHVNGRHDAIGILPVAKSIVNGLNKAVPENQMTHQDEREQKRQKRKLSNRESARRSRERKQKECEDFARQVAELNTQNNDLRAEIDKLNLECKKLKTENASIVEELKQLYGPSVLAAIEGEKLSMSAIRILGVECNGHIPEGSNLVPMVYQSTILLPTSNVKAQGNS